MIPKVYWEAYPLGSSKEINMEKLELSGFILYLCLYPYGATLKVDPFGEFPLVSKDLQSARNEAVELFQNCAEQLIVELQKSHAMASMAKLVPSRKEILNKERNNDIT